ncbi:FAD-dependent oxidoreductase [Sorangium sp. So ce1151]|uniref:FAD-dependent oxidoreductase n=1 Tax=Sorangium sp. So ce1151 TaxID=3133332 RepID=UPI003F616B3C
MNRSTQQHLRSSHRFGGRRAVVIGGSIAGLVAARVLADHFDEVIVVERDGIPDDLREARQGVPQARQVHGLLARGERILNDLFPGFTEGLIQDGAIAYDFGLGLAWHHLGAWKPRCATGVQTVSMTRPLLEAHVRRRTFALSRVRRLDRRDVVELSASADRARVTGVVVRRRDAPAQVEELAAELVVDASGRGSRGPAWLEELGYARPDESTIKVRVGYASRQYQPRDLAQVPWTSLYVLGSPSDSRRFGCIVPIEGGRWMAVLAGLFGDHPPADTEGFLEFARGLPNDAMYRALLEAEPVTGIATYKFPAHLRRHYERMERMPEGFAVLGDALASFNPVYGQGMTSACLQALALDAALVEQRRRAGQGAIEGLARRYHAAAAKAVDLPWQMSTGEDLAYPETEGQRPLLQPLMRWYTGMLHRAAQVDRDVYVRFVRAMHMLDGPEALVNPRLLLRVLRAGWSSAPLPQMNATAPVYARQPADA